MITRYIATNRYGRRLDRRRPTFDIEDVAIGGHLTLFKTLRNAVECAGSLGAVWLFDLQRLPRIAFDNFVDGTIEHRALERARTRDEKWADHMARRDQIQRELLSSLNEQLAPNPTRDADRNELYRQFVEAEQQMVMWSERAVKLERMLEGRSPSP